MVGLVRKTEKKYYKLVKELKDRIKEAIREVKEAKTPTIQTGWFGLFEFATIFRCILL